jgi:hypothetical protein
MREFLLRFFEFDYDIVGEYLDTGVKGHLVKQYIKRYKFRRKAGGKWRYLPIQ